MQFNIPQFIDVEDRIVGPLTFKQLLYLGSAGVLIFFIWYFFKLWVFVIVGIPIGTIAIALAFLKINGRPFIVFLSSFFSYLRKPKMYVWRKDDQG
ncbi:MAG: hypothetical protein COT61_04915 [Candidatus Portnoybacteria bacterium CG09_land_8_20_14_0_10_44_13]|uniref:PrgI family protein n=4 Tax=Candidatus Portnoyibacteriota TaxID=1817913 RepID=A0A2H0KPS9_9BACT|nr:MAG: hypothetical protein AUK17_03750 [Parcubacteria group bacterium CG2_30_44_18]PIQ74171.1 MAG: hypothetical protein COV85_03560 [Candidatus Portnoybacteria bacterium CG11_big_fil_rev_8_21_14_0_20_44_10]PIS16247.1 MAG: hypothetical protein COT61_04915 [Candidatus Portnoybacteria bacterium CG09_land_8_20_14_0_10_44_13]PIZ70464.1 MAG: hypothetical protein COY11_02585 [Candidatus Portnoybacteria bacterium CG_4_10_14_0_2_um_filter_44_20]PJA62765.1 MAG: hypothetical protein CO161_04710 [Candida